LQLLHENCYVHGDIKSENICMRRRDPNALRIDYRQGQKYESEFEFTLIDFGIISRFKVKKTCKQNSYFCGNLMFGTLRQLMK
jgi:serine/threonine protein kinase